MLNALLLLVAATSPIQARCLPGADQATTQLRIADQAMARHDFHGANVALDGAIDAIGDRYAPPGINDDTGMHRVFADSQRRNGKPKLAAALKRRILVERIQLCRQPGTPVVPASPRNGASS